MVHVTYQVDQLPNGNSPCYQKPGYDEFYCNHDLRPVVTSGWGILLQHPFRRQGLLNFNYDIGFSIKALQSEVSNEKYPNLTLKNIQANLYGASIPLYLQLGITPENYFPDLLIRFGPAVQLLFGTVSVNDDEQWVGIFDSSKLIGFSEIELVFIRFGEGAFSFFSRSVQMVDNQFLFYPDTKDGMKNFQANFSASSSGFKIILNWP